MSHGNDIRHSYAEEIRALANLQSEALVAAFAKVPREHFLGPGPWQIPSPGLEDDNYRTTNDDDLRHLYRNVLVAIDPSRQLNNGQPSYLAFCVDALDLRARDHVLHVGCGVGYYTAIIAEVVGTNGQVTAVEIDAGLAAGARKNLAYLPNVVVVRADGGEYDPGPCDAIFVNAGATHPRSVWLDRLQPGGRLVLFLTTGLDGSETGRGGLLKVRREERGYAARFLSSVTVFHCLGARDAALNRRLERAFRGGKWKSVKSLRREEHEASKSCWLHGNGFCLSRLDVPMDADAD